MQSETAIRKKQLLKGVLAAIDASKFAYVQVWPCYDRHWQTLACGDKSAMAVGDLFKKRCYFEQSFELQVKDLEAKPHKITANFYWPGVTALSNERS